MSKSVIRSRAAALGVLEAAHTSGCSGADWLEGIGRALEAMLHAPGGVAMVILERLADRYRVWPGDETKPHGGVRLPRLGGATYTAMASWVETIPLRVSDAYYQQELVGTQVAVHESLDDKSGDPSEKALSAIGMKDALGVNGRAGRLVLNVSTPADQRLVLSAADRGFLSQIALHLGTGLALRQNEAAEVAVINPDGRLLHAAGAAREPAVAEPIVQYVCTVERARSRRGRSTPEAVEAWRAMVAGRWGLVERVDSDGRRHYVALETAAGFSPVRALSSLEASVLELSARGVSGKLVSYALGISAGRVSQALQSCALKIGCVTRTEVVRIAAALLDQRSNLPDDPRLTDAERAVLALVRRGFTNAEIAEHRGSSPRTVANQIASLLAKAHVSNRRALAASL